MWRRFYGGDRVNLSFLLLLIVLSKFDFHPFPQHMVLQNAYKTLMDIGGLETEAEYGYDGEDEACKFNRSKVSFFHLLIFARSTNPMFFVFFFASFTA